MNPVFEYDFSQDKYVKLTQSFLQDFSTLKVCSKIMGIPVLVYVDDEIILHEWDGNKWIETNSYSDCLTEKGIWSLNKHHQEFIIPFERVKTGKYLMVGYNINNNVYGVKDNNHNYLIPFNAFELHDVKPLVLEENPLEYVKTYILQNGLEGLVYYNDCKAYSVTRENLDVYLDVFEKLALYKIIFED